MKNPKPFGKAAQKSPALETSDDADDTAPADDIVLGEAEHILADYSELLSGKPGPVVTQR